MTPEKETGVATATELHADLLRMSGAEPDSRMGKAIVALMAAVRAETLEEAAKEMRDQFDASKHDLDLNGIIKCRTYKDAELRIRALVSK